jgi:DNA polymerase III subunit chi
MAKVNFYLLKQSEPQARKLLACRLAEQQAKQGQRIYVLAASEDEARELDHLLWSFAAESFVPHTLSGTAEEADAAVVIGHSTQVPVSATCVLNLGNEPPLGHADLATIAEFVANDDDARARSRALWGTYKQLGYELQLHQL